LLAAQTVVMAVARSATGAGALLALDRFLMQQLDDRVVETGWRSSILYALAHPR
jgi:two-component system OmpR family sensor kinase